MLVLAGIQLKCTSVPCPCQSHLASTPNLIANEPIQSNQEENEESYSEGIELDCEEWIGRREHTSLQSPPPMSMATEKTCGHSGTTSKSWLLALIGGATVLWR